MSDYQSSNPLPERIARLYDSSTPDWPGEMAFYESLIEELDPVSGSVLELACGTGRVSNRIAAHGLRTVGIDLSQDMLDIAVGNSPNLPGVNYVQADMRNFDIGEKFDLVIAPGHGFQHMLKADEQIACLESAKRHMNPDARLVLQLDHQDIDWLGRIATIDRDRPSPRPPVVDPKSGNTVQSAIAW